MEATLEQSSQGALRVWVISLVRDEPHLAISLSHFSGYATPSLIGKTAHAHVRRHLGELGVLTQTLRANSA